MSSRWRKTRWSFAHRRAMFIKVTQMIERIAPGIAFVSDPALQDAQRRAAAAAAPAKAAGELGNMFERGSLGDKTADLQFRVHAFLQTPEHLENKTIAIHDGGIALFSLGRNRFRQVFFSSAQFAE